jgi:folate-binding protein YgfZ
VLRSGTVGEATVAALHRGAVVARADVGVLELIGPGAAACLQGLLTGDIEAPGDGAFVYGALLTPKGMIIVDGWATRLGAAIRYTVPALGRAPAAAVLARSIPPRLARTNDRSDDLVVWRLAGPQAQRVTRAAGLPLPTDAGRALGAADDVEVARGSDAGPFAVQVTVPRDGSDALCDRLLEAGAVEADADALELMRVLAGWPTVGGEVDAKTIPQEVRFDELGGVSYTKGCYTGQETVSRVHFRGHANRHLVGLEFTAPPPAGDPLPVTLHGDEVGRVTTLTALPAGRWIGLAVVRREVAPRTVVEAGGVQAETVALPFPLERLGPA